jgi:hypothetical protein
MDFLFQNILSIIYNVGAVDAQTKFKPSAIPYQKKQL